MAGRVCMNWVEVTARREGIQSEAWWKPGA
jgi:hypothetical protein